MLQRVSLLLFHFRIDGYCRQQIVGTRFFYVGNLSYTVCNRQYGLLEIVWVNVISWEIVWVNVISWEIVWVNVISWEIA